MPRNSPAVERAISVLNFFAEHPQQSFTLSQIIKSMHLSRATGYGLMSTLVNNGYLFRNSDKSFVLGPALLAIGRNAQQSFSALDVARLELRKLADELDVVAMAVADEGDVPVVRERAASRNHLGWAPPPGSSYPLPHFGAFFGCNLSPAQLEEWLDSAPPPSAAERKAVLKTAAFIRTYGYTFAVSDDRAELARGGADPTRNPGRTITVLDPSASYELHCVEAPVVNERGVTAYVLALYRFSGAYSGEQVAAIGARLIESCRRITTFMGGPSAAASLALAR